MVILKKGFMREGVRKSDLGAAFCSHCCIDVTAPITCKEDVSINRCFGRLRTDNSSWKILYRHSSMPRRRRMAKSTFFAGQNPSSVLASSGDRKHEFERISLNVLYRPSYHRWHHFRPNDRKKGGYF